MSGNILESKDENRQNKPVPPPVSRGLFGHIFFGAQYACNSAFSVASTVGGQWVVQLPQWGGQWVV